MGVIDKNNLYKVSFGVYYDKQTKTISKGFKVDIKLNFHPLRPH